VSILSLAEFQYTGYFVYRCIRERWPRQPKLSEFIPDAQFVGKRIVVNGALSERSSTRTRQTLQHSL